ncbi:MAG: hypothetical protein KDA88_14830 [Planctomycetaceae bacterium]|nr:hypothetical protein [Planctomycetaceae bacterium]
MRRPLEGVRVHLSGSVPDDATEDQRNGIREFALRLASAVLKSGGTLIHGSHPTITVALLEAAKLFVDAGGSRDSMILVRDDKYAKSAEQLFEIKEQRALATVQLIPSDAGNPSTSLVAMREWMAERSDIFVAIGGKWYDLNPARAGVVAELEFALERGRPGFVLGGFGGAVRSYLAEDGCDLLSRLRNGLTTESNRLISESPNPEGLVQDILGQIKRLPSS